MKYLVKSTEVYRVDTEHEATAMIEEAKENLSFSLSQYSCKSKENKKTGDEWYQVSLVKIFNDEKEPGSEVVVSYEVE